MSIKAPRFAVALVAIVSLVGFAAPADAAAPVKQTRTIWCC